MGDTAAGDAPYVLHCGDVLDAYAGWPAPATVTGVALGRRACVAVRDCDIEAEAAAVTT